MKGPAHGGRKLRSMPHARWSARHRQAKKHLPAAIKKKRGFPLPLRHGKTNQWCYFATYLLSRCYLTGKNGHTIGMMISETIMQIIVSPVPTFT